MNPIRILSAKKLTPSQQELLLHKGFALVHTDFIKVAFSEITTPPKHTNIIVTSKNGILSIAHNTLITALSNANFYCVGTKTAALLASKNLNVVKSFPNSKALGTYLVTNKPNQGFSYFCGNIRRKEMPSMLRKNGIELEEIVAYKTFFAPQDIPGKFDGVLFFSPSQAESFFFSNKLQNATAFCIGKTTADTVRPYTNNIVVAKQPTVENVIVQVVKHFETKA